MYDFPHQNKRVKDLVRRLTEEDEKNISQSIERILNSRKKKLR